MAEKNEIVADVCRKVKGSSREIVSLFCEIVAFESGDKFDLTKKLSDDEAADLANHVADRLKEKNDVGAETLKMQARFHSAYAEELENVESMHRLKQSAMDELRQDIVKMKPTSETDFETISMLHRRIFSFLMLAYDEKLSAVEREVAAAMESVFPRAGLKSFVALSVSDKSNQLMELFNIVFGIRLFNKEVGKGGVSIDNVPQNLLRDCASLTAKLEEETRAAMTQITSTTDAACFVAQKLSEGDEETMNQRLGRVKMELIHRHQYYHFLSSLLDEINATVANAEEMHERYSKQMKDLTTLVGGRSSVPKDQVYPKFDILAATWMRLDALWQTVKAFERIFKCLQSYKEPFESIFAGNDIDADAVMGASETSLLPEAGEEAADENTSAMIVQIKEGEEVPVPALHGFCPVSLVEQRGLLRRGQTDKGMVLNEQSLYACVDDNAQRLLVRNPTKYTAGVLSVVKDLPQLVHLLRLDANFPSLSVQRALANEPVKTYSHRPKMVDADSQTPTHFVEKNIDYSYDWNEWNLRRRALQLADLRNKATVSTQSNQSHFRRDVDTQHYSPRQQATQTMKESSTNVPK
eukprot:CAMPEP_0113876858 /NCGR_PEP_ID=MMETSP0780_2-20120614/5729_1 /TAXON_ID=652834 /ORGANISM="Palpitomonas bilix" /LENGTH=581 /DNA_ID=CAMNT_0000863001 /DNA_START=97 /DNA_END=1842 /DNA_ORIENTATION=+ /assembly_acc=CAM_ASM_000599